MGPRHRGSPRHVSNGTRQVLYCLNWNTLDWYRQGHFRYRGSRSGVPFNRQGYRYVRWGDNAETATFSVESMLLANLRLKPCGLPLYKQSTVRLQL